MGAMKMGADNCITKPIDINELLIHISKTQRGSLLVRGNRLLRMEVREKFKFNNIIATFLVLLSLNCGLSKSAVAGNTATQVVRFEILPGDETGPPLNPAGLFSGFYDEKKALGKPLKVTLTNSRSGTALPAVEPIHREQAGATTIITFTQN